MEYFLSGYCRCQDQSRRVLLEMENKEDYDVDCNFGVCPYEADCQIAAEIREKLEVSDAVL